VRLEGLGKLKKSIDFIGNRTRQETHLTNVFFPLHSSFRNYWCVNWWESQKERDRLEDQDVDGWTILKWILER
jgi:hypothetical protein